jgi:hypothetical protein
LYIGGAKLASYTVCSGQEGQQHDDDDNGAESDDVGNHQQKK